MNQVKDVQLGDQTGLSVETSTSAIVAKVLEPLEPINLKAVEAREMAAVKSDDQRRLRIGRGVSRWAQEIFDALAKT